MEPGDISGEEGIGQEIGVGEERNEGGDDKIKEMNIDQDEKDKIEGTEGCHILLPSTSTEPSEVSEPIQQHQQAEVNEQKDAMEEKPDAEASAQNSVVSRLTVDQLLEYVKKQNAKVKKLKLENDEFRSQLENRTSESQSNQGFWRDIRCRPVWQQQLARGVLHYLFQSILRPKNFLIQLRRAFLQWHRACFEIKISQLEMKISDASETKSQLEQRVAKLKTLLAKMHQSNQKNVEDTVIARKNQLEIALEYQQRMTQEEAEKQALEEQLRCLAFESALHSDMEFAIEKAAQQIAEKNAGNNSEVSQSLKNFELQQQVSTLEKELLDAKQLTKSYETKILQQSERLLAFEKQIERNKDSEDRYKAQISLLQRQATDLEIARQDLEVELKILVSNRTNVAAEIEARSSAKASQLLWKAGKRGLVSESREERQNREISILRKQVADLQTVQVENENLVKIVREMKKSIGASPNIHSGQFVSQTDGDKFVSEGEISLLKRIHQESMLIVDRETFQHILRQSEAHERSLLSASQHLTDFDSNLKLEKRKNTILQSVLSNSRQMGSDVNIYLSNVIDTLTFRTLRYLDALLGFESLSITSPINNLQDYASERCRARYNSFFQNIESLDDILFQHSDFNGHEDISDPSASALPSLIDHSLVEATSSYNSNISERFQQALSALKSNSKARNLTVVYRRILNKMKKTESQLSELILLMETAKAHVETTTKEISCHITGKSTNDDPVLSSPPLPVVTIHPHHLKWEAIDIKIPAGGVITLPIPTPILPSTSPSDAQLLILSKHLSVTWSIRSSSTSYIQVSLSAPSKGSLTSKFDRLRSEPISNDEVIRRCIQFGYVRTHEDILSRIGETVVCGQQIINTSDGNRVLEISNRAVWATITLSYQIEIDNYITEHLPPTQEVVSIPEIEDKQVDQEHLSHLHQLQGQLASEHDRVNALQQKIDTLNHRLQSMSGPLLLLRETFKTGLFLREKICSQWDNYHSVQDIYKQHLEQTLDENESKELVATTSFDQQQSVWLQDLELIKGILESHEDTEPIVLNHIFPPQSPASLKVSVSESSDRIQDESMLATISPNAQQLSQISEVSPFPERILLSSSNLKIRPSSDFRCPIKIPQTAPHTIYTLSWDFTLLSLSGDDVPSQTPNSIDIGFCVLGRSRDGSFPLLTSYQRIGPVGTNIVGSLEFLKVGEDNPEECGGILRIPYSEVILLFDNTYSWFKPKFIRYEISLDFNSVEDSPSPDPDSASINPQPLPSTPSNHGNQPLLAIGQDLPRLPLMQTIDDPLPTHPTSLSIPQEILTEVTNSCAKLLQISEDIHEFVETVTSLTYK